MKPLEHDETGLPSRPRRSTSARHGLPDASPHTDRVTAGTNGVGGANKVRGAEREKRGRRIRVTLSGEFDLKRLRGLRKTLRHALDSGHEVFVDLSEVAFIDALCLRELVVQYRLHPCLSLLRPSSEVKLALAICNLENWVRFRSDREVACRPRARTGVVPRGDEPEDAARRGAPSRKLRPGGARCISRRETREAGHGGLTPGEIA